MVSSLKGLRKALNTYFPTEVSDQDAERRRLFFEAAKGTKFWYWDRQEHIDADIAAQDRAKATGNPFIQCCFNHLIGLPFARDGVTENPLFPYQRQYIQALDTSKLVYCLKSTGSGISEVTLRWLAWRCLRDDTYRNTQIVVLTGPRQELAISEIARVKQFFARSNIFFNSKETVIELNSCRLEAYPSHHLDSARGLPAVKALFLDEFAFFPNEDEALQLAERYIAKSDPHIILVTTPNKPATAAQKIRDDPRSPYTKVLIPYTAAMGTMYDMDTLRRASKSASFAKEYNLQFSYGSGSLFSIGDLERCKRLGNLAGDSDAVKANEIIMHQSFKTVGIDMGYGENSYTGFVILGMYAHFDQQTNSNSDIIQVLCSRQYNQVPHERMMTEMLELLAEYNVTYQDSAKIYIDNTNIPAIRTLKAHLGDKPDYYIQLQAAAKYGWKVGNMMKVIPVSFSREHKNLLSHLLYLIQTGYIGIHESHTDLLASLGSSVANDLSLDKSSGGTDLTDAMRLACSGYVVKHQ
jgi:hypothetical protein